MLKSLEPRPILFGLSVAVIAPMAIGILLRIFQSIIASIVPAEQAIRFLQSPAFLLSGLTISLGAMCLSGYVAGRKATVNRVLHGLAVGVLSVAIEWALRMLSPRPIPPLAWGLSVDLASVGFAALGGYLAARQLRRDTAQ